MKLTLKHVTHKLKQLQKISINPNCFHFLFPFTFMYRNVVTYFGRLVILSHGPRGESSTVQTRLPLRSLLCFLSIKMKTNTNM